jgi:hypothetical protein
MFLLFSTNIFAKLALKRLYLSLVHINYTLFRLSLREEMNKLEQQLVNVPASEKRSFDKLVACNSHFYHGFC